MKIFILLLGVICCALSFQISESTLNPPQAAVWNIGSQHRGIYLLINNYKFHIPSVTTLKRLCVDGATTMVDDSVIDKIPAGDAPITENAQLATSLSGGPTYLLTNGEKWRITTIENFLKYGFDSKQIAHYQPAQLDLFKTGRNI